MQLIVQLKNTFGHFRHNNTSGEKIPNPVPGQKRSAVRFVYNLCFLLNCFGIICMYVDSESFGLFTTVHSIIASGPPSCYLSVFRIVSSQIFCMRHEPKKSFSPTRRLRWELFYSQTRPAGLEKIRGGGA
jgi:hypothetical protein